MSSVRWQWAPFAELDGVTVHAMLAARQQVFVLEQQCLYPDIDALDGAAHHLLGWCEAGAEPRLVAYLRCIAPGVHAEETVLGRVLTSADRRGLGLGRELMHTGIDCAEKKYPGYRIRLSAQAHLEKFYASVGFQRVSDIYLEDDIPHIAMLR